MSEEKKQKMFAPLEEEQLRGLLTALSQDPVIVEGAAQAPEEVREGIENASKEFLEGFIMGASQFMAMVDAANKAAREGNMTLANAFGNRANTLNYMVAKQLLEGQNRIITPNSGPIIH